jgi:hypothetical protein
LARGLAIPLISFLRWLGGEIEGSTVTTSDEGDAPSAQLALMHRVWPVAALALAAFVNVLWIGVLGYLLVRLLA